MSLSPHTTVTVFPVIHWDHEEGTVPTLAFKTNITGENVTDERVKALADETVHTVSQRLVPSWDQLSSAMMIDDDSISALNARKCLNAVVESYVQTVHEEYSDLLNVAFSEREESPESKRSSIISSIISSLGLSHKKSLKTTEDVSELEPTWQMILDKAEKDIAERTINFLTTVFGDKPSSLRFSISCLEAGNFTREDEAFIDHLLLTGKALVKNRTDLIEEYPGAIDIGYERTAFRSAIVKAARNLRIKYPSTSDRYIRVIEASYTEYKAREEGRRNSESVWKLIS